MSKSLTPTQKAIAEACNNDPDVIEFVSRWLANGKNATKAYQEMRPETTYGVAAVLGSRMLKKVNIMALLAVYGLGVDTYIEQLRDGIKSEKYNDFSGEREPDHKTRAIYHTKLGKIMGIEDDRTNVQVNILNHIQKEKSEFEE